MIITEIAPACYRCCTRPGRQPNGGGSVSRSKPIRILAATAVGVGFTFAGPAVAGAASKPPPGHYGPTIGATCAINTTVITPGGTIVISCTGFGHDETVAVSIASASARVVLGTAQTGSNGSFTASFVIPTDLGPGRYSIVVTGSATAQATAVSLTVVPAVVPTRVVTPPSSSLAFTGTDAEATVGVAAAAIGLGGALTLLSRRRRRSGFSR